MTEQASPGEVVQAFFAHAGAGDLDLALTCWAPDAVWHVTGQSSRAGDYKPSDYLAMGAQWNAAFPDYRADFGPISVVGELAFFPIRSQGGEAPDEALGMMIYRVVGGVIAEGWAIPASHGGRFTF